MTFRLRTLLVLVTVCGLAVAWSLQIANQKEKRRLHRTSFEELDDQVAAMDNELSRRLMQIPSVMAQLQAANPIDPPMALGHSVTGESLRFGRYQFERHFHYHWQLADGTRAEGLKLAVSSVIDDDPSAKHLVKLTYVPSEINNELASWIALVLKKNRRVQIEHVTDRD
ncbi:hypothetical protein NZK35_15740 [Stieleria sp. ICT_E10.1]|uniref:hypothetical protein n=1 Tax=Stieleria sedimenti TaxID=2976331 RepID=UPI00217FCD97|nr:hypothetical protein [Stieleria sedimenti]MCS7468104.1 hypothetical protein [Stieleria sedimenti]